ncbi:Protein MobE [Candidatus Methylobacter favarea]|uniref:Protein MobE n=1 Tax=Candidatus Methylobacter favarea TaxID=2707345 RepID=A0A8S0YAU2_9GAMM|nr:protein mobE [Candidatus Methylobacter favarea]CAA9892577.1 Protein MobE [Candidatus Methylobacter favarea]
MTELDDSFAKLLGRQPSDAERQQLYTVRDALGLKNNDALWLVLMALQHYQDQYETFPKRIAQSANETLVTFKATAEATVKASAEAAKADLAQAVALAAREVAYHTSAKQMWQWAGGCLAVAFLALGLFGWYVHSTAYDAGYNSGYGVGYAEAKDEKAAAAWANTPQGKLAYRFAQSGELQRLAKCEGKGWTVEKGYCFPYPLENQGTYGWRLP